MQSIENNLRSDTMLYHNIPVFRYHIAYPSFTSTCNQKAVETINEFYLSYARRKERFCRLNLYPQAVEAARYITDNNPPFNYYEFDVAYQITLNKGCITSLYMEEYTYMGGAHGSTIRTSDTWDFKSGKRISLKELFAGDPKLQEKILKDIQQQIVKRLKTEPQTFFDDYPKLLRDSLNLNSFYLTPNGTVIYFQQYDIAPYAVGFPEFVLSKNSDE